MLILLPVISHFLSQVLILHTEKDIACVFHNQFFGRKFLKNLSCPAIHELSLQLLLILLNQLLQTLTIIKVQYLLHQHRTNLTLKLQRKNQNRNRNQNLQLKLKLLILLLLLFPKKTIVPSLVCACIWPLVHGMTFRTSYRPCPENCTHLVQQNWKLRRECTSICRILITILLLKKNSRLKSKNQQGGLMQIGRQIKLIVKA